MNKTTTPLHFISKKSGLQNHLVAIGATENCLTENFLAKNSETKNLQEPSNQTIANILAFSKVARVESSALVGFCQWNLN